MMLKGLLLAAALLLTACSGGQPKTYYQLPTTAERAESAAGGGTVARQLWLEHVSVADYLASSGLVYQTSDVRYVIASNNLWASPLEQQLRQALLADLNGGMPGWLISDRSLGTEPEAVLNVTVTAFHGRYDGKAVVRGEWTLSHRDRLTKQPFDIELPQTEDGYDALVRTLGQGWQQVAQSIARQAAAER